MARLVDRFGRTGTAALTSLIWAIPMSAWAGSWDLSPVDKTAYPWVALSIGLAMLAVWLVVLSRLGRLPASKRPHRFDFGQMSTSEKRWSLGLAAFFCGLVAWLSAAGTVDWTPLGPALQSGKLGPILLAMALLAYLLVMLGGIWFTWRRSGEEFRRRRGPAALE
ncbi:MAG: hypothetical protein ACREOM_05005 [Candidatus Dormibacteraceae bacterium]